MEIVDSSGQLEFKTFTNFQVSENFRNLVCALN